MSYPPELTPLVSQITALIPDASISSGILDRLRREYEGPPCTSLELLLRRGVSPSSARGLLFHPSPDENGVGVYGALIGSPPPGSGESHPLRRVQTPFLSLLYLVHLRSWPACAAFVRGGGLGALSRLLLDPNVYLRGQALECFLQITSHPDYDWFQPPSSARDDRDLHDAVLALAHPVGGVEDGEGSSKGAASVPFLSALLQNWDTPAPGVSFGALQLVAWWLSWVRALYSKGGELRLSGPIIAALQAWALRPEAPMEGGGEGGGGGPAFPHAKAFSGKEEATLAKKLYEDFSRFPILGGGGEMGGGGGGGPSGSKDDGLVQGLKVDAAWARAGETRKSTGGLEQLREEGHATGEGVVDESSSSSKGSGGGDTPQTPLSPQQAAALCKEQGNAHFRGERWGEASRVYGQGITAALGGMGNSGGGGGDSELLLALLSNRALSRLRAAGYGSSLYPAPSMLALLSLASPAAQSSLSALLLSTSPPEASGDGVGGEDEGEGGKGGDFKHLLSQCTPPQKAALVCLFGALSDCERALALNPRHKKVLLRKAQVLVSLGEGGLALECCKTALAVAAVQGEDSALAAQCSGFLTYVMTYVSSRGEVGGGAGGGKGAEKEKEKEEEEEELSILSALLCRAEYGGMEGGGKQNSTLLVHGPNRGGSVGREESAEGEEGGGGGEEEEDEGVGQLLKGWVGGGEALPPHPSKPVPPASSKPSAPTVSVDDILSGRLKEGGKDKASKGKKTFSLPTF